MRICFFANLAQHSDRREMLRRVEFYNADLTILRELGHEVVEATTIGELDRGADLYFCWWWGPAIVPLILARLRGKPLIVTGAFDYATCRAELPGLCFLDRPRWQRAVISTVLRLADASMFVSEYEFREVTGHLRVAHPWLVPHSVVTQQYDPSPHEPFVPDFFFAMAWTSRENVVRKGVDTSIEAFAQLARIIPDVRFVLAGKPGDGLPALVQLADRLGVADRVDFVGMIPIERKLDYFRRCIAYVQPSLYEGFGVAIAEAASIGCPIVATGRGAIPEVCGPDAALLGPGDIEGIALAMSSLVGRQRTHPDEMQRHRWIAKRYDIAIRRKLIAEVIASVL